MGEDVICSRSPHKLVTLKTGKSYLVGPDHCDVMDSQHPFAAIATAPTFLHMDCLCLAETRHV